VCILLSRSHLEIFCALLSWFDTVLASERLIFLHCEATTWVRRIGFLAGLQGNDDAFLIMIRGGDGDGISIVANSDIQLYKS